MPKGAMTGNPTNIVCWLEGGHFSGTVWGIAYDQDNLLDEIRMTHYENERAKKMGVKILGITKQEDGDTLVEEVYELVYAQSTPPAFAIYIESNSPQHEAFFANTDDYLKLFKRKNGYDLPDHHLDPKNMPGETRKVDV